MTSLTVRQAFDAMRYFLEQFNAREPEGRREAIEELLGWTEFAEDGVTNDPAQWDDWLDAVTRATASSP